MSGVVLDEVHCLWPSCCHTCCWEAEQRVREGRPKTLRDPDRPFTRPHGESRFPVFTLVDAANWIEDDSMALSPEAASQKYQRSQPMSAKLETCQDNKKLKTAEARLDRRGLSVRVFPPADWKDVSRADATASPKDQMMMKLKFEHRAVKNKDLQLSRRIVQSRPELDTDLVIRGITAPWNSSLIN